MNKIYVVVLLFSCLNGGLQAFPLHDVARVGDVDRVGSLLDGNADPDENNYRGDTPLRAAIEGGHCGVVQLLLEKGADPNKKSGSYLEIGITPLQYVATNKGNGERERGAITQLLLTHGADVHVKMKELDKTALHFAAEKGFGEVVDLLLSYGARVNELTGVGQTSLDLVLGGCGVLGGVSKDPRIRKRVKHSLIRHHNVLELLLSKGANPQLGRLKEGLDERGCCLEHNKKQEAILFRAIARLRAAVVWGLQKGAVKNADGNDVSIPHIPSPLLESIVYYVYPRLWQPTQVCSYIQQEVAQMFRGIKELIDENDL